jgi:hypothetical protein
VSLRIVSEQAHGAVPLPGGERLGLVLALPVRELELQDQVPGRHGDGRVRIRKRLLELERPLIAALLEQPGQPLEPGPPFVGLAEPVEAGVHGRER